MSEPTSETITCPGCGHQQAFTVWESLNVTLDPKLKERLIDGRLTTFTCEECRECAEVVSSLLYHDMAKQVMIWLIPGDEEPEKLDPGAPDLVLVDPFVFCSLRGRYGGTNDPVGESLVETHGLEAGRRTSKRKPDLPPCENLGPQLRVRLKPPQRPGIELPEGGKPYSSAESAVE